ncbi:kinase-like protein, partial [Jaminaea rosea]
FERHYIQLSILGSGEFSEAVKASSVSSGQVYAIKRMKRPFTGPRDRLRHLEEVDILRHLGSHPNVISLHEAWEQDAHLYIAAELCPLGTLALFLEGYGYLVGHLDEPRLWKVLVELSAGLAHIHESGVLHLDLKPANVFITAVGTLKIGDFGL